MKLLDHRELATHDNGFSPQPKFSVSKQWKKAYTCTQHGTNEFHLIKDAVWKSK